MVNLDLRATKAEVVCLALALKLCSEEDECECSSETAPCEQSTITITQRATVTETEEGTLFSLFSPLFPPFIVSMMVSIYTVEPVAG